MGKDISLKNYQLIGTMQSLGELMQVELPVKVGWNLKKNMKKLEHALKDFSEVEQELVSKYAVTVDGKIQFNDDGQPKIYPAKQEVFKKEHTELINCENSVDILSINISDIMDRNIKPSLLFNLEFMIEDDLEEEK